MAENILEGKQIGRGGKIEQIFAKEQVELKKEVLGSLGNLFKVASEMGIDFPIKINLTDMPNYETNLIHGEKRPLEQVLVIEAPTQGKYANPEDKESILNISVVQKQEESYYMDLSKGYRQSETAAWIVSTHVTEKNGLIWIEDTRYTNNDGRSSGNKNDLVTLKDALTTATQKITDKKTS